MNVIIAQQATGNYRSSRVSGMKSAPRQENNSEVPFFQRASASDIS